MGIFDTIRLHVRCPKCGTVDKDVQTKALQEPILRKFSVGDSLQEERVWIKEGWIWGWDSARTAIKGTMLRSSLGMEEYWANGSMQRGGCREPQRGVRNTFRGQASSTKHTHDRRKLSKRNVSGTTTLILRESLRSNFFPPFGEMQNI